MHVVLTILVLIALALALVSLVKLTAFQSEVLKERRVEDKALASLNRRLDTLDDKLVAVEKNVKKALKSVATGSHSQNPGSVPAATTDSTVQRPPKVEVGKESVQEPAPVVLDNEPEAAAPEKDVAFAVSSAPETPAPAEPSSAEDVGDMPDRKQEAASQDKYINFDCSYCLQNIDAPYTMVGENIRCPTCSKIISVPRTSTSRQEPGNPGEKAPGATGKEDDDGEFINDKTVRIDISDAELMPAPQKRKVFIRRH